MMGEAMLMGLESELLLGCSSPKNRAKAAALRPALLGHLQRRIPGVPCLENHGGAPGLMLANGGRIYLDGPCYIESATPEVTTPRQVLAYQRAHELLLLEALPDAAAGARLRASEVSLSRIVTDHAETEHFCGQHVNILVRRHSIEELVPHLVPYLVTRYYAAAGGLGQRGFSMTQKNRAVRCVASSDTRENRGIINIKRESLCMPPFERFHLVHGDALMADLGAYLTVGCTALVLRMLDDGVSVGPAMALEKPLQALQQLDDDPSWSRPLRLASGGEASGLAIQEHYVKAAERYVRRGAEPWMMEIVRLWRESWYALKQGSENLATRLDPYIKLRFFGQFLATQGMAWNDFNAWASILALVDSHLPSEPLPASAWSDVLPRVPMELTADRMERHGLEWNDLPRARALWRQMKMLDLRYHDIGTAGLFWQIARHTRCPELVPQEEIRRAMSHPPAGTRAAARGAAIRQVSGDAAAKANWSEVIAPTVGRMELNDPFKTEAAWLLPK